MPNLDPWGDKAKKRIQFSREVENGSARRKAVGARRKPAPKKQGSEELRAMKELREMPKRIGKRDSSSDLDLRQMPKMGMSNAQKETFRRDILDNMRSRNLLRAKKKRG